MTFVRLPCSHLPWGCCLPATMTRCAHSWLLLSRPRLEEGFLTLQLGKCSSFQRTQSASRIRTVFPVIAKAAMHKWGRCSSTWGFVTINQWLDLTSSTFADELCAPRTHSLSFQLATQPSMADARGAPSSVSYHGTRLWVQAKCQSPHPAEVLQHAAKNHEERSELGPEYSTEMHAR